MGLFVSGPWDAARGGGAATLVGQRLRTARVDGDERRTQCPAPGMGHRAGCMTERTNAVCTMMKESSMSRSPHPQLSDHGHLDRGPHPSSSPSSASYGTQSNMQPSAPSARTPQPSATSPRFFTGTALNSPTVSKMTCTTASSTPTPAGASCWGEGLASSSATTTPTGSIRRCGTSGCALCAVSR